ncbi:unnamed protein product [Pleuronectes platessa]|uniref:Uncharacterized protein n=1 Tax=Pleuronectes platessa TaxID=8262 RepID=A0A9N7V9Y1_PLEPL|nr:unnamed protein product [Pleuronectes platessa]
MDNRGSKPNSKKQRKGATHQDQDWQHGWQPPSTIPGTGPTPKIWEPIGKYQMAEQGKQKEKPVLHANMLGSCGEKKAEGRTGEAKHKKAAPEEPLGNKRHC